MKRSRILLGLATLTCAIAVSGCNTIRVLPTNYKNPIILNSDGNKTDVYDNLMSEIYDQIGEGKNDRVHEEIINIIANDQFGSYDELKTLVESNGDFAAFAETHKDVYKHDDDESVSQATGKSVAEIQTQRIKNTYNRIKDRVNKVFYDEIKSGS